MIKIIPYSPKHEQGIQYLCSLPVSGDIAISLERKPDYITGAYIQTEKPEIYIAVDKEVVIGLFNIGHRRMYINNNIKEVRYLCDLRIHPDYQNTTLFYRIAKYIRDNIEFKVPGFTVVFEDNQKMQDIIKHRMSNLKPSVLPYYHKISTINSYIFNSIKKPSQNHIYHVRPAISSDVQPLEYLQSSSIHGSYQSYIDFSDIKKSRHYIGINLANIQVCLKNNQIVGYCMVWDTSSVKQAVIKGYSQLYSLVRRPFNLVMGRVFNYPKLPNVNEELSFIYVNSLVIKDENVEVLHQLLTSITQQTDKPILITLDIRDPLNAFMTTIKRKLMKKGCIYAVSYDHIPPAHITEGYINIDAARI